MSVCAFNSLSNGEYSYLLIAATFSSKFFLVKTSLPIKNSYLQPFPGDKVEILTVCLSRLY